MHDLEIRPDSIVTDMGLPTARGVTTQSFTAAIHARTPMGLTTPGIVGDSVDIVNDLTTATLVRKLEGVAPGPQSRTFELGALPDPGAGSLSMPGLERVGTRGTITFVDNAGASATGAAVTGITLTGGAYLRSVQALPASFDMSVGWSLSFSFRAPNNGNGSRVWASLGRRDSEGTYGIQLSETSIGQLSATIQDPRFGLVTVRSAVVPRNLVQNGRLTWSPATRQAQWFVNGTPSGAAVLLPFKPDVATGRLYVGTNLGESSSANPIGSIHQVALELANVGVTDTYLSVGSVATLTAAEAASLHIDTLNFFSAVPSAGSVSVTYGSASGPEGVDAIVSIDGYRNVVERLPRFVSASSFWCSIDLGTSFSGEPNLVLTPPALGEFASGLRPAGSLVTAAEDSTRPFVRLDPSGNDNPAGPITRGWTGMLRLQQRDAVREFPLTELNLPPKLNGGGEAWGHADDLWVPIHSLWYNYNDSNYLYPTYTGETPTVTVTAVPGPGEGTIRVTRTGPDLRVGDTVPFSSVRRLGWAKPGVAAVPADCRLGLRSSAPGAPDSNETYSLKITDAPRPADFGYWGFPTTNYADSATNTRWAARGGDWRGVDGMYGAVPFVQTATVNALQTLAIDVTAMVAAQGPQFFIVIPTSGALGVGSPSNPGNVAAEPRLRVTGGARAGEYRATRWGSLGDSDSTAWRAVNTSQFTVRRAQAALFAFDGAGAVEQFADATRIELVLTITGVSSGGGPLQLFAPAPQTPRPGPRILFDPTPARSRADLLVAIDRDDDWRRMLTNASDREQRGSNPTNWTLANGCYYGGIPARSTTGMNLFRGYWKADNSGYPVVRMGRMMGWHINYQPADTTASHPGVSGKTIGMIATGKANLDGVDVGRGGISVSGLGGYSCRGQRGKPLSGRHRSDSPLHPYMVLGDYSYFINGSAHGQTNLGVVPVRRMRWLWIETVHRTNMTFPDGRWQKDGSFELYVNGRKHCEYFGLEYRIGGNPWLWDAIWFDEYNGGTGEFVADRLWPFVVGPTYVVEGDAPIAPPAGWNVPFVDAEGRPDTTPLAYNPE